MSPGEGRGSFGPLPLRVGRLARGVDAGGISINFEEFRHGLAHSRVRDGCGVVVEIYGRGCPACLHLPEAIFTGAHNVFHCRAFGLRDIAENGPCKQETRRWDRNSLRSVSSLTQASRHSCGLGVVPPVPLASTAPLTMSSVTKAYIGTWPRTVRMNTFSPFAMPRSAASAALIMTVGTGRSAASEGVVWCSAWRSTLWWAPELKTRGKRRASSGFETGLSRGSI